MLNSPIEEIKSKLDIVEVIGSYIKLQKAGANYKAICPFHTEKTSSFFVSPARQIWHCFGCGEGHSVFDFIMKIEGVEFGDALKILAHKAGVELKPVRPEVRTKRQRLYEICELAVKFYEKQMGSGTNGQLAKKYLNKRGITDESIARWRLGWALNKWDGLTNFLTSRGYSNQEIEQTGLAIKNEKGRHYDRFRGRIIFPVLDFNSQAIGFGGRILKADKEAAKYINSPATILYDKSRVVYGLDRAKVEIRKKDSCILAEGYIDVIMAHQAGIQNMVATSGTALTHGQLTLLKRYSDKLNLAFDMDLAGDAATKRGIELAQSQGFDLKIITMPKGKDPADVMLKDTKDFKAMIENSLSILEFYFDNAFSRFSEKTPEAKKEISNILLPVIARIPNKIEQSHWVSQLAQRLGVKEKDVEEELGKINTESFVRTEPVADEGDREIELPKRLRKDLLEERLVTLISKAPQHLELIENELLNIFSVQAQEIFKNLDKPDNFSKQTSDYFSKAIMQAELEIMEEKEILPEIQFCLRELKFLEIKNKLDNISLEIKKAESVKDLEKVEELKNQFNEWTKKITSI
jgi:DNA primase